MAGVVSTTLSGIRYLLNHLPEFWELLAEHMVLVIVSEMLAVSIAIPLGVIAARHEKLKSPILSVGNVAQTIPPLAVIALMFPILGLGFLPSFVALFIYALLPVMVNTITGLESVEEGTIDAAKGMGMTQNERLTKIRFPLALPVIFAGIRTSTVINVGTAYLAFFIGGGGLGAWVISGINLFNMPQVFAGAISGAVLAISLDLILAAVENRLGSTGPASAQVAA